MTKHKNAVPKASMTAAWKPLATFPDKLQNYISMTPKMSQQFALTNSNQIGKPYSIPNFSNQSYLQ